MCGVGAFGVLYEEYENWLVCPLTDEKGMMGCRLGEYKVNFITHATLRK